MLFISWKLLGSFSYLGLMFELVVLSPGALDVSKHRKEVDHVCILISNFEDFRS